MGVKISRKLLSTRKLCPNCGEAIKPMPSSISGWLIPDEYLCESCGYSGSVAIEPQDH